MAPVGKRSKIMPGAYAPAAIGNGQEGTSVAGSILGDRRALSSSAGASPVALRHVSDPASVASSFQVAASS